MLVSEGSALDSTLATLLRVATASGEVVGTGQRGHTGTKDMGVRKRRTASEPWGVPGKGTAALKKRLCLAFHLQIKLGKQLFAMQVAPRNRYREERLSLRADASVEPREQRSSDRSDCFLPLE